MLLLLGSVLGTSSAGAGKGFQHKISPHQLNLFSTEPREAALRSSGRSSGGGGGGLAAALVPTKPRVSSLQLDGAGDAHPHLIG